MRLAALMIALVGAMLATSARAALRVTYHDPDRFTDADRAGGLMTAEGTAQALAAHLVRLAQTGAPGLDVAVEILDIDLAGRLAPELDPSGSRRVMDGSTWPRIRLRYVVSQRGRGLAQAEELISWQDYLQRSRSPFAGDPLRFEKALLSEWFESRIASRIRLSTH